MAFISNLLGSYTGGLLGGDHSQSQEFDPNYGVALVTGDAGGGTGHNKGIDAMAWIEAIARKRAQVADGTAGDGFLGRYTNSAMNNQEGQDPGFWRSTVNQGVQQLDQKPAFRIAGLVRDYFTS